MRCRRITEQIRLLAAQDISSEDFYSDKLREALQESDEDIETLQDALEAAQARDSGVRLTVVAQDGTLLAGDRTFHCKLKEDSMRIRADREDNFWFVMDRRIELSDGGSYSKQIARPGDDHWYALNAEAGGAALLSCVSEEGIALHLMLLD